VYLTDCDPSELSAGQFVMAEIVNSRDYDLVARPLEVAVGQALSASPVRTSQAPRRSRIK